MNGSYKMLRNSHSRVEKWYHLNPSGGPPFGNGRIAQARVHMPKRTTPKVWSGASLLLLVLAAAPAAADDACLPRPPNARMPLAYTVVSGWGTNELQLLVDEYTYQQKWRRHSDAVEGGFRYGDEVFGETLKPRNFFDAPRVKAWKLSYASGPRTRYLDALAPRLGDYSLDRQLIQAVLTSCFSTSLWSAVSPIDDCRFTFAAGVKAPETGPQVLPVELAVIGGRCEAWPDRPIGPKGRSIRCIRSGNGSVTVSLLATRAGSAQQMLPPLKVGPSPAKPALERRMSEPLVETLTLYRARDYRLVGLGQSCPSCRLFAADFHPSRPDAVILDVSVVASSEPERWLRCPAGYRCGAPEFSPPDQRNAVGCKGLNACRVWRLSTDEVEGRDTIQITFTAPEDVCKNCPTGVAYAEAHRQWDDEIRTRARRECSVFPDPPAQSFDQYLQRR